MLCEQMYTLSLKNKPPMAALSIHIQSISSCITWLPFHFQEALIHLYFVRHAAGSTGARQRGREWWVWSCSRAQLPELLQPGLWKGPAADGQRRECACGSVRGHPRFVFYLPGVLKCTLLLLEEHVAGDCRPPSRGIALILYSLCFPDDKGGKKKKKKKILFSTSLVHTK